MSVNPLHLFAEDPYHPPGYAGYVPQKMYRHAGTYGRTTHDILKDERVPYKITRTATSHTFDRKSHEKDAGLISGYTGHVPISRDQFGLSYVPKVNSSMDSFNSRNSTREELRKLKMEPSYSLSRSQTEFLPRLATAPPQNPTDLGVISGYTGYIPKLQHRFAKTYLNRVEEARNLPKDWKSSPVKIKKQYTTLYHPSGCIPNYTGFLPGHQFRHAMTYGHSSRSIETK